MKTEWSFLQSWLDVLRASLSVREPQASVAANFSFRSHAWENTGRKVKPCSLHVNFPVDETSRTKGRENLQRLREAMELFNMLNAVNNAMFVELLSDFMKKPKQPSNHKKKWLFCPTWKCYVIGELPSTDLVSTQASVTWGSLFGCPDNPWEYSSDFQAAMKTLEDMGADKNKNWWYVLTAIDWQVGNGSVVTHGLQRYPVIKMIFEVVSANSYAHELGKHFALKVPPLVHLCTVGDDISSLVREWREHPYQPNQVLENRLSRLKLDFESDRIPVVTEALARLEVASVDLALDDNRTNEQTWRTISNAGFLLSMLVYGRSMCQPLDHVDKVLERPQLMQRMEVTLGSTKCSAAFYSALAHAPFNDLRILFFGDGDTHEDALMHEDGHAQWRWLAYALGNRDASTSLGSLEYVGQLLTAHDVDAVANVVKANYPEPEVDGNSVSTYGFIDLPKGVQVRPLNSTEEDAALTLARPCRCRAKMTSLNKADVVVPGYGVCSLSVDADAFVRDSKPRERSQCLRDLELSLFEVEDNAAVPNMLAWIGYGLHKLSFSNTGVDPVTVDLSALAAACPGLRKLCLIDVAVVVSDVNDALRNWPLKKLILCGTLTGLGACLGDPTFRMYRELKVLDVDIPQDWVGDRAEEEALNALDGEYLPLVKQKFPMNSKLAMISVVHSGRLEAMHRLDSSMLSLIFGFAATPVKRRVEVKRSGRVSDVILNNDRED